MDDLRNLPCAYNAHPHNFALRVCHFKRFYKRSGDENKDEVALVETKVSVSPLPDRSDVSTVNHRTSRGDSHSFIFSTRVFTGELLSGWYKAARSGQALKSTIVFTICTFR